MTSALNALTDLALPVLLSSPPHQVSKLCCSTLVFGVPSFSWKVTTLFPHVDGSFSTFRPQLKFLGFSISCEQLPPGSPIKSIICFTEHDFIFFTALVNNRSYLTHSLMNLLNVFSLLRWKCLEGPRHLILLISPRPRIMLHGACWLMDPRCPFHI